MDQHEKYFFDLNGYLVVQDALSAEEVSACNDAIDNNIDRIEEREQSLAAESET